MHAINALLSGVKGAENGSVVLYKRGTSTPATYYTAYDGTGGTTCPASGVALDGNGGIVVFVNENVRVIAKDSSGATVRDWVEMTGAPVNEVMSQSFTGTAYDDGESAAGNPVSEQAIFNLWKTNAGAIDWKVLLDGTATTLQTAFGRLTGPAWYNVQDPTYGAVGDGSTNDTTAIAAAITACNSAGGGIVYFPQGTYKISSTLTIPSTVSLMGASVGTTKITMAHGTANCLTFSGSDAAPQTVERLWVYATQANTGNVVVTSAVTNIVFRDCVFGENTYTDGNTVSLSAASHYITFDRCRILWHGNLVSGVSSSATGGRTRFTDCTFTPPATCNATNGWVYGKYIDMYACTFLSDAVTSGTCSIYKSSSTTLDGTIVGCRILTSGGGTITGMTLGTYVAASKFMEAANNVPGQEDANFTLYSYSNTVAQTGSDVQLRTRDGRFYALTSTAAAVTIPSDQYGSAAIKRTDTSACTYTFTPPPEGAEFTMLISASGANAGIQTLAVLAEGPDSSILDTHHSTFHFRCMAVYGSGGSLALVSVAAGNTDVAS